MNEPQHKPHIDTQNSHNAGRDFEPGSLVLDKYLVISQLGSGGMGSVYRVKHLQLQSEYALKCLNKQHANDASWRRFNNEARAAHKLDHPNLIKVHDSGLLPDGQPYFLMDVVDGITLAEALTLKGKLSQEQSISILIQVGFGLAYAHDNGVVHRDIKPSNIMIVDAPNSATSVKIVDFGIAKLTGKDEFNQLTLTRTGEIIGSPLYMSPEQCAGLATDHRSDLYSLGCVMYEVLSGAPPILADNALSTMVKHQTERPVSLKEASLGEEFPEAIERIVARLLAKEPAQRYQDAHKLTKDLIDFEQELLSGSKQRPASRKSLTSIRNGKDSKRGGVIVRQTLLAILLLSIGYLLGLLSALTLSQSTERSKPAERSKPPEQRAPAAQSLDTNLTSTQRAETKPFSTISNGGKSRQFHFPQESLGALGLSQNQKIPARGLVPIDHFTPISLGAQSYAFEHPELFSRFRKDELCDVQLRGCDVNLDKILNRLVPFEKLESLVLTDSSADNSCLPIIDKLTRLKHLNVNRTRMSGTELSQLKILPQLKSLQCSMVADIKPLINRLDSMPNLTILDLSECGLDRSDIIKIGHLSNLQSLDLTKTKALNDATFQYLGSMTNLSNIDLEGCPLTAASIGTLKKLRSLSRIHLSTSGWSPAERKQLERSVRLTSLVWVDEPISFTEEENDYQHTKTAH